MDYTKVNIKAIYLKFGSDCNLNCKYCHAEHVPIKFNPEILPVLKKLNLTRVNFGGGEPLLYWDKIKETVRYLGDGIQYKFVTNGVLLTNDIVDFCNKHEIYCYISIDGINSARDVSKSVRWDLIRRLWFCGHGVTIYRENQNIRETLESLTPIKERYLTVKPDIWSSFPNFVHSTSKTGLLSDRKLAVSFVRQITELTKEALELFKNKGIMTMFLKSAYSRYVKETQIFGVNCCNDTFVAVLADGTVCVCPYTFEKVGDLFHLDEIDWKLIHKKYTRPACSSCSLFNVCGNYCCANITDDECYIMRALNKNIISLMQEYNITSDDLEKSDVAKLRRVFK